MGGLNQSSIIEDTTTAAATGPSLQAKNTFAKPSFMIKKKF